MKCRDVRDWSLFFRSTLGSLGGVGTICLQCDVVKDLFCCGKKKVSACGPVPDAHEKERGRPVSQTTPE